jgi:hypothetical protein
MPEWVWDAVVRRDRVCQASAYGFGSRRPCAGRLVVHHRRLRSQGGKHDPELCVALCNWHHIEVHDNPRRAQDCGLIVSTMAARSDPSERTPS